MTTATDGEASGKTLFSIIAFVIVATAIFSVPSAHAAESSSFRLTAEFTAHAVSETRTSQNFQVQEYVTWKDRSPESSSFKLTFTPPAVQSAAATSEAESTVMQGGGRGHGTNLAKIKEAIAKRFATIVTEEKPLPHAAAKSERSLSFFPERIADFSLRVLERFKRLFIDRPDHFGQEQVVRIRVDTAGDIEWIPKPTRLSFDRTMPPCFTVQCAMKNGLHFFKAFETNKISPFDQTTSPLRATIFPGAFHAAKTIGGITAFFISAIGCVAIIRRTAWHRFASFLKEFRKILSLRYPFGKKRITKGRISPRSKKTVRLLVLLLAVGLFFESTVAHAANTMAQRHVYAGHLLDSNGNAITRPHTIRFSYWTSSDYGSTDTTSTGSINTSSSIYGGWQETHEIAPNTKGYFSVELGSGSSLPALSSLPTTFYLQVEVKIASAANTAYELLDTDTANGVIDRSTVLPVPFALNADTVDHRDVGTGSGAIPVLKTGGFFDTARIPGGTASGVFVIDFDNTESGDIELRFGNTIAEKLYWDRTPGRFRFSDDLYVDGDLTASGILSIEGAASFGSTMRINGVTYTFPQSDGSASGKALKTNAAGVLSWSDDSTGSAYSFSEMASWMVNDTGDTMTGALTVNVTGGGDVVSINARQILSGGVLRVGNNANVHGAFTASGSIRTDSDLTLNDDQTNADTVFTFGSDITNETLTFLNAADRFEFSDDLRVSGGLSTSGGLVIEAGQTFTVNGVTYTFPTSDGSMSGKVLTTNGAGTLSWSDPRNGSGHIIFLSPQYPGAVYFSSGTSFVGQLSASGGLASRENYYHWTSTKTTMQDYWIAARVRIPSNFASWDPTAPIELRYRTGSGLTTTNYLTMRLFDTGGTEVALTGGSNLVNTSFTTATITGPQASGTYTAGSYITIYVKLAALDPTDANDRGFAEAGFINLKWETKAQ